MRLALYQPDIPQNAGTILRTAACLGVPVDIIGPAGFDMSDRALRRAALDYIEHVDITRHIDWPTFLSAARSADRRLILATTKGAVPYTAQTFSTRDTLLFGRETNGVPDAVHAAADARIVIPIRPPLRSLNLAVSVAMILGEATRQLSTSR
jgi:tRNA (cytidine/uridine-2'-O-)-methyltransferase